LYKSVQNFIVIVIMTGSRSAVLLFVLFVFRQATSSLRLCRHWNKFISLLKMISMITVLKLAFFPNVSTKMS